MSTTSTLARVRVEGVATDVSRLADAIEPIADDARGADLAKAKDALDAARNAISATVEAASSLASGAPDTAATARATIDGSITSAEQSADAARDTIMAVQQAGAGAAASLAPAVAAATRTLAETQAAIGAAKAVATQAQQRTSRVHQATWQAVGVITVAAAVVVIAFVGLAAPSIAFASVTFATLLLASFLLLVIAIGGEHGLVDPIIGADNRFSTSKTQAALWTLFFGFGIAYLLGRVAFDHGADINKVIPNDRFDEYLFLLGGPFAAGVVAKLATTWKVDKGQIQKTTATETTPSQLLADDDGNTSLVDAQYLLFNVIALGYFALSLWQTPVLPEIPVVLFGLTSASAATYAATKVADQNAPAITAVSPRSVLPGGRITVSGVNFVPPGDSRDAGQVAVLIEGYGYELRPLLSSATTDLVVDIPTDVPAGTRRLSVRTSARVLSAPFTLEVLADKPVLYGVSGAVHPGKPTTMTGRSLRPAASTNANESVGVVIDRYNVVGTATDTTLTFTVPAALTAPGDAQVTVTRDTVKSDPITVHLS